jgi:hypothetical protein
MQSEIKPLFSYQYFPKSNLRLFNPATEALPVMRAPGWDGVAHIQRVVVVDHSFQAVSRAQAQVPAIRLRG